MRYLVWDIESIPTTELASEWSPKSSDEFPPLFCHRVVCIGMLLLDSDYRFVKAGCAADGSASQDEARMIARFIEVVGPRWPEQDKKGGLAESAKTLVDFNGKGFDLPVIQHRALWHGLTMPFYFAKEPDQYGKISGWSKEYRDRFASRHLDLCELWSNFGASRRPNLHTLARLCGLPGKMDVDGSDMDRLYQEGLFGTIDRYCLEDVFQTTIVFLRWLHLRGELSAEDVRERIETILKHMDESGNHPGFMATLNRDKALLR